MSRGGRTDAEIRWKGCLRLERDLRRICESPRDVQLHGADRLSLQRREGRLNLCNSTEIWSSRHIISPRLSSDRAVTGLEVVLRVEGRTVRSYLP